jgi:hypothetical protein
MDKEVKEYKSDKIEPTLEVCLPSIPGLTPPKKLIN